MNKILHSLAIVKADSTGEVGKITVIASTNGADRADDILDQANWKLDNYKANPLILWSHDRQIPSIGKGTPRVVGTGKDQHLEIDIDFDMADPLAASIARKFHEKYLNAVSVGFRPGRAIPRNQLPPDDPYNAPKGTYGYAFYDNELTELSPCNVPCNAQALAVRSESEATALQKSMDGCPMPPDDAEAGKDDPPVDDPAAEVAAMVEAMKAAWTESLAPITAKLDAIATKLDAIATKLDDLGKKTDKQDAALSGIKANLEAVDLLRMDEDDVLTALSSALDKSLAPGVPKPMSDEEVAKELMKRLN